MCSRLYFFYTIVVDIINSDEKNVLAELVVKKGWGIDIDDMALYEEEDESVDMDSGIFFPEIDQAEAVVDVNDDDELLQVI